MPCGLCVSSVAYILTTMQRVMGNLNIGVPITEEVQRVVYCLLRTRAACTVQLGAFKDDVDAWGVSRERGPSIGRGSR